MKARFFRDAAKFLIETEGPDGRTTVFEVAYTFGWDPLQQYLIRFPGGRMPGLLGGVGRPGEEVVLPLPRQADPGDPTGCTGRATPRTGTACAPSATPRTW